MKRAIFCFFLIFISTIAVASASSVTIQTSISQPKLFGVLSFNVPLGQAIEVQFKVKNVGSAQVLINKARVTITDPSGKVRLDKIYMLPRTILYPNDEKSFTIKTGIVADKEGVWKVKVTVYSNDVALGSDVKTFEVEKPTVNVQIANIVGYGVTSAGILGIAYYLIRKRTIG